MQYLFVLTTYDAGTIRIAMNCAGPADASAWAVRFLDEGFYGLQVRHVRHICQHFRIIEGV